MGLWEPLLEPLDDEEKDVFRPWTLAMKVTFHFMPNLLLTKLFMSSKNIMLCLQMKKKPVSYSGVSDEVDGSVPDYKTVISFSSKDQLNVTLSKCGLHMLSNLGTVRDWDDWSVLRWLKRAGCLCQMLQTSGFFCLVCRHLQRPQSRPLSAFKQTRLRLWWRIVWVCRCQCCTAKCLDPSVKSPKIVRWSFRMERAWIWTTPLPLSPVTNSQPWPASAPKTTYSPVRLSNNPWPIFIAFMNIYISQND